MFCSSDQIIMTLYEISDSIIIFALDHAHCSVDWFHTFVF